MSHLEGVGTVSHGNGLLPQIVVRTGIMEVALSLSAVEIDSARENLPIGESAISLEKIKC